MTITQLRDSNTLLTYALDTVPLPLQASPTSGAPAVATVTLVVSLPKTAPKVVVKQIAIVLPIANPTTPEAADLATTAKGIGHSVSSSGTDKWTSEPGTVAGSFVIKPATGESGVITGQGLTISFPNIQVSPIVGTAWIKVVEVATADTTPAQPRQAMIAAPKFPPGVFAGNFAAKETLVKNGEPAELTWMGSYNANYSILWDGKVQDVTSVRSWKSPALTNATTFMLAVSAQQGGQTVVLYFTVPVNVSNPDLSAKSLTVAETSTLKGKATLNSDATIGGTATITGAATLKNGLTVAGASNLSGDANVVGALNVSGLSTLGGGAKVGGTLSSSSKVALLGKYEVMQGQSYQAAETDALVIGYVAPRNGSRQATIVGRSDGMTVFATGGGIMQCGDHIATLSSSFVLPVRKGQEWEVGVIRPGPTPLPDMWFYWVPLGVAPRPKPKSRKKKDAALKPKAKAATTKPLPPRTREIAGLTAALEEAFGQRLSGAKRTKLKKAIGALVGSANGAGAK